MICRTQNVVVWLLAIGCASALADDRGAIVAKHQIESVLNKQIAAWNTADIPTFMKYYWRSEQLTFSSGGTTRRGWKATKESYEKRYPTPEKMGQLAFSKLEVTVLHHSVALVLGNWNLKRQADEDLGGNFSLVFRKIDGQWRIIHDHSSLRKDE